VKVLESRGTINSGLDFSGVTWIWIRIEYLVFICFDVASMLLLRPRNDLLYVTWDVKPYTLSNWMQWNYCWEFVMYVLQWKNPL